MVTETLLIIERYAFGAVIVNDVTATELPATMLVVFKFRSDPDVPTFPSSTWVVPSDLTSRNHVAVPVASADESDVIELRVRTPLDAEGANVALQVSSASSVVAVPPVAGRVPL
jgi:hypothetical protein